jgi:hypothetical protein
MPKHIAAYLSLDNKLTGSLLTNGLLDMLGKVVAIQSQSKQMINKWNTVKRLWE